MCRGIRQFTDDSVNGPFRGAYYGAVWTGPVVWVILSLVIWWWAR